MKPGDFSKQIYREIKSSTCVILLLTPHALDSCAEKDDWVRLEIAYALKNNKTIIPLMLEDFEWPDELPDDIKAVRNQHGIDFSPDMFDARMKKLAEMIHEAAGKKYQPQKLGIAPAAAVTAILLLLLSTVLLSVCFSRMNDPDEPDPDVSSDFTEPDPDVSSDFTEPDSDVSSEYRISEPYLTVYGSAEPTGEYVWMADLSQLVSLEYRIHDSDEPVSAKTLDGPCDDLKVLGSSDLHADCTLYLKAVCPDGSAFEDYFYLEAAETEFALSEDPTLPGLSVETSGNDLLFSAFDSEYILKHSYEWVNSNNIHSYLYTDGDHTYVSDLKEEDVQLTDPRWLISSTQDKAGNCTVRFFLVSPAE